MNKTMSKKEQLEFEKHFETMEKFMGGIEGMIDKGILKVFNNQNEVDKFFKNKTQPTEKNSLVVDGIVGDRITTKESRNQKCICGSGLKYKKCCLNKNVKGWS